MPEGIEVHLPTDVGNRSLEQAVRAVAKRWPHAVCENGDTGERYEHLWQAPLDEADELFVYRDGSADDAWDQDGAVPATHNTMIHLIADDSTLTVVVDERDAEMDGMIEAIEAALAHQPVEPSRR